MQIWIFADITHTQHIDQRTLMTNIERKNILSMQVNQVSIHSSLDSGNFTQYPLLSSKEI